MSECVEVEHFEFCQHWWLGVRFGMHQTNWISTTMTSSTWLPLHADILVFCNSQCDGPEELLLDWRWARPHFLYLAVHSFDYLLTGGVLHSLHFACFIPPCGCLILYPPLFFSLWGISFLTFCMFHSSPTCQHPSNGMLGWWSHGQLPKMVKKPKL